MQTYRPTPLPPGADLETRAVLKRLPAAHSALAEFKGVASTIPNEAILLSTLVLQEAKDSSAVENIITTHDELFQAELQLNSLNSLAAKEVQNYGTALRAGFEQVRRRGFLGVNHILEIQRILSGNEAGFRRVPGTALRNEATGQMVYQPPQDLAEITALMDNLVRYMNEDSPDDPDPLLKMAVAHFQFESIHPFYDGNGRTGRIINILYLVLKGLLNLPVLYLSRHVIRTKAEYYARLQAVRDTGEWEPWLLYMLQGVEDTAREGIVQVGRIRTLMQHTKHELRTHHPALYSQDLLNNLFKHPYTKIEFVCQDLGLERKAAARYLNALAESGLLEKLRLGRSNYYVNRPLFDLFLNPGRMDA